MLKRSAAEWRWHPDRPFSDGRLHRRTHRSAIQSFALNAAAALRAVRRTRFASCPRFIAPHAEWNSSDKRHTHKDGKEGSQGHLSLGRLSAKAKPGQRED
jgi:hypothetical protein